MKIIDLFYVLICVALLILIVIWGVKTDEQHARDLIDIYNKIDTNKVTIYKNCYEISNSYVCIED